MSYCWVLKEEGQGKEGGGGGKSTLLREADEQKKTTLSPALTSLALAAMEAHETESSRKNGRVIGSN